MRSLVRGGGRLRRIVLATALGVWVGPGPACKADGPPPGPGVCPTCHKPLTGRHNHGIPGPGAGTLGYGPPGLYPGFQGFGSGYHLGYGYGGRALGVGAEGGYPFYGGPGYPHPWPTLKRIGRVNPFPYYGGPGGPTPGHPNFYGAIGQLAPDQPVVVVEKDPRDPSVGADYGGNTGMVPYPETTFAPFITIAAAQGSASGVSNASPSDAPPNTAPAPGEMLDEHGASQPLGLDTEPFTDPAGGRGLKVTRVAPGSPAQAAGLRIGDVIASVNGYATSVPSHLMWVIANAAPERALKMSVRAEGTGQARTVTLRLP